MAFTHDHFGVAAYFPGVSRRDLLFYDTVIAQNGSTMPIGILYRHRPETTFIRAGLLSRIPLVFSIRHKMRASGLRQWSGHPNPIERSSLQHNFKPKQYLGLGDRQITTYGRYRSAKQSVAGCGSAAGGMHPISTISYGSSDRVCSYIRLSHASDADSIDPTGVFA